MRGVSVPSSSRRLYPLSQVRGAGAPGPDVLPYGRWRTLAEVHAKIQAQPCMRGVVWAIEGEFLVGRKGAFVMKLRMEIAT